MPGVRVRNCFSIKASQRRSLPTPLTPCQAAVDSSSESFAGGSASSDVCVRTKFARAARAVFSVTAVALVVSRVVGPLPGSPASSPFARFARFPL